MAARTIRNPFVGVSIAALLIGAGLAAGLTPAFAQAEPRAPAILLPPQPEVDVRILATEPATSRAELSPAPLHPALLAPAITAPAIVPPAKVDISHAPRPDAVAPVAAVAAPAVGARPPVITAAPATGVAEPRPMVAPVVVPASPPAIETGSPSRRETLPAVDAATSAALAQSLRSALEAAAKEPNLRGQTAQKQIREQILAFYTQRQFAPLWVQSQGWNSAASGALSRIAKAADDGLDVRSRAPQSIASGDEKALVAAEIELTQAVIAYGQQAGGSRVDPRSISALITEKTDVATPEKILAALASANDPDAALAAFNPSRAGYKALREKLAEVRRERPTEPVRIAAGPTLKPGMKDARSPSLRERFQVEIASDADPLTYDVRIAAAVTEFQRGKGISASGQLNPATVAALASDAGVNIEGEILANMERWRWLPRNEAADRIEVNIPDYTVRVIRGGELVHSARVIVGKPNTPTPIFSNRMQFLEVNPYWNVPESIIRNEMMPRMARDPGYLERQGYEVRTNRKGELTVRQPPGNRNALGFIKFMFPNQHAVYLHDTPTRNLFSATRRAYSHGCVRVDQPFKLAEIVLGKENGWNEQRVKKLIGTGNKTIQLPQHLDVHLEYFTAFVDDSGKLQLREDIYGYSRRLKSVMGLAS